ncbi:hypothetical protein K7G98_04995 [Saccharothrix sp. MB29]|nr:hypothetical protein [Saccharothrix sp. MB29]
MWQTAANGGWSAGPTSGTGAGRVTAGNNADGRIEVFASNATGVFHRWQTDPGRWSAWEGVGGPARSRLAMESSPDGRLEVFALSDTTFGHLFQTQANGRWSAWEHFGDGGHDVTVDHNTDGRLEVFASGPVGVFHRWQTSGTTWSAWTGTGGPANSELTSARTVDGRVEVIAINADTAAHTWQTDPNAPYSGWQVFGTGGTEIGASTNADGRVEVFGAGHAGVFHKWQTSFSTWSDWAWLNDSAGPGIQSGRVVVGGTSNADTTRRAVRRQTHPCRLPDRHESPSRCATGRPGGWGVRVRPGTCSTAGGPRPAAAVLRTRPVAPAAGTGSCPAAPGRGERRREASCCADHAASAHRSGADVTTPSRSGERHVTGLTTIGLVPAFRHRVECLVAGWIPRCHDDG